jgi:hypothetical protein
MIIFQMSPPGPIIIAHRSKALNLKKKLHVAETTKSFAKFTGPNHFHTIENPLHHPKSSAYAHFHTTTTIASEPMLSEVGALKVHSHLVLGTLGLSPPNTMLAI